MRFKSLILGSAAAYFASATAAFASRPTGGAWLQEPVTPTAEGIHSVHMFVFVIITIITLFVLVLQVYIWFRFNEKRNPVPSKTTHHFGLEVAWTIIPVFILLAIIPMSIKELYHQDALPETEMTVKVMANTWNWEYAYPEYDNIEPFVSNIMEKEEAGADYLLKTDAPLVVPVDTKVKVLLSSYNNLHSFAMPAFGVKMDAVPGRINETWFQVYEGKEGVYYGQCSEICGVKHAYMPIEIHVVSQADFQRWVANNGSYDVATTSADKSSLAQR